MKGFEETKKKDTCMLMFLQLYFFFEYLKLSNGWVK